MQKGKLFRIVLVALIIAITLPATGMSKTPPVAEADQDMIGHWKFDDLRVEFRELEMVRGETFLPKEHYGFITNNVGDVESDFNGRFFKKDVKGVKGDALLYDGYTNYVQIDEDEVPRVSDDFSVSAWLAPGNYPTNIVPIINNQRDPADGYFNGYFFGMDALGRLIFRIATKGQSEEVVGTQTIPLYEWTNVAGTYSTENGLRIYINGELVDQIKPDYEFTESQERVNILMGKSRIKRRPYGTIRTHGTKPYDVYYSGLMDEVKIYDSELSSQKIKNDYAELKPDEKPDLEERKLPTGPLKAETFTAVNTNLEYYEAFNNIWHVNKGSDLVVRFDQYPCELVFWKGTGYQAALVTEKGFWFNNGFNEGWTQHGSAEPMSDKQSRYNSVKILEKNDARIVVQWRYALIDNWNDFAFFDPVTRRGDWTEETYYIYPDMVAVREDVLLSNAPRAEHEWQESMVMPGPGQRPEDMLEYAALTLGNDEGEFHTYSWEHETPPALPKKPANPNMQLVNMKSEYKPFSILRPQDNPSIDIYAGEIRREISVFPWWNHWPVAQKPTDGRWVQFADRASHSSISHWFWDYYDMTDRSMTKLMLTGMTNKSAKELMPLARSWYNAPEIEVDNKNIKGKYNQAQRAYFLTPTENTGQMNFQLKAEDKSPIVNPAFVIKNWGEKDIELTLNGKKIEPGKNFRYGKKQNLNSSDLVVWIKYETKEPVEVKVNEK